MIQLYTFHALWDDEWFLTVNPSLPRLFSLLRNRMTAEIELHKWNWIGNIKPQQCSKQAISYAIGIYFRGTVLWNIPTNQCHTRLISL